jgi:hypothetical protein
VEENLVAISMSELSGNNKVSKAFSHEFKYFIIFAFHLDGCGCWGERSEVFHFSTTLFATFVHFPLLSIFFTFSLYLLMMQKLFHFDYRLQKCRLALNFNSCHFSR